MPITRLLAAATQDPASLSERALRRQAPEVRAGCGNAARPDLCGGRPERAVPTATEHVAGRGRVHLRDEREERLHRADVAATSTYQRDAQRPRLCLGTRVACD